MNIEPNKLKNYFLSMYVSHYRLIQTSAFLFSIAFEASVTFTNEMSWQITALGIRHTSRRYRWIFALIYI